MKKVAFKVDKFTDFAGNVREVVFAAVSLECEETEVFNWVKGEGEEATKVVRIGVSAQNPRDAVANTELGKTIAEGKAMKDKSCFGKIFSTDKGFINKTMVEALLTQEMEYFKQNPGKYLKGYNRDKELYSMDPEAYWEKIIN